MIQLHHTTLLADVSDLLQALLPIIVAVLYGIAHLVGALQQEKRKAAAKSRPAPPQEFGANPPAERKPVAAANQPTLEETLRREVEEFLRRSQGQPAQSGRNDQRPPQRSPQPAARQRPASAQRPRQADQRARQPEQPRRLVDTPRPEPTRSMPSVQSQTLRPSIGPGPLGAGVTQYVAEQMRGTQELVQHAQSLGSDVAQADERLQSRLQQRFVHQVGTLAPLSTATSDQRPAAAGASAAQELRALLSRPAGVRQVIIASEILRRPEERWDH
jgi:hypothetical protein